MDGTLRRLSSRSVSGSLKSLHKHRPVTGSRLAKSGLISHCLPTRWGPGPYNSREDDEPYLPSDASDIKDCEGTMQWSGRPSSSAQPSGWIRMDASSHCQPTSHFGASSRSGDSSLALPFTIFSSAASDFDHGVGMSSASSVPVPSSSASSSPMTGPAAAAMRAIGSSGQHGDHLWTLTDEPGIDMFLAGPLMWGKLCEVYVILFGVDGWDTEGIYSLRAFSEGEALPQETIIAFESEEDAQRYAGLLEATMDHVPYVCGIAPRELLDFCLDEGYNCRLEPVHSLLIPPDCNVGMTDWERSLRLRNGQWAVLASEPTDVPSTSGAAYAAPSSGLMLMGPSPGDNLTTNTVAAVSNLQRTHAGTNVAMLARYAGMSHDELDNIRGRLERLLDI